METSFGKKSRGPMALALWLQELLGHSADCTRRLRLMTAPSYALEISLGCSNFDVLCEYGLAGVAAIALRGSPTVER